MSSSYWERFRRSRISRRRMLGAVGAGAAGLAVAAACGGGDDGDGEEAIEGNETPRPGGQLVTGTTVTPTFGLDPHTDVALGLVIFPRMYGYMLHEDPRDESLQLDHAASQPERPDETTIIIKLTPNIAYHQNTVPGVPPLPAGRTVEAEDVVQSFIRYEANPLVTGTKTWHRDFRERMEATDPLTVTITLKRPYVYSFETIGGILSGGIIPREHTTDINLNNGGIGSGPYMIQRAALDTEIEVRRNPNYFRQPLPYLDSRVWRIIRDTSALRAAFIAQQVDVYAPPDKIEADEVEGQSRGGSQVIVHRDPNLAYASFSMNVSMPPFNDVRVREAIDLALWREDIISKVAFDDGEILGPINHHLREGFWALPTSEIEEAYGLNMTREERVSRARDLLEQAGQANAEIQVKYPNLANISEGAELTQQHLQETGLRITLEPQELAAWFLQYREAGFHATYQPHLPYEGPNIPSRFFYSKGVSGDQSFFEYSNPDVDALIEQSWEQFDPEERKQTLLDMQRLILQEHGPMLNIYTGFNRTAYWSYVHGIKPELPGSLEQYVYDEFVTKNA